VVIESVKRDRSGLQEHRRWLSVVIAFGLAFLFQFGVSDEIIQLQGEVNEIMIAPIILTMTFMLGFFGTFSLFQILLYLFVVFMTIMGGGVNEFNIEQATWISLLLVSVSIRALYIMPLASLFIVIPLLGIVYGLFLDITISVDPIIFQAGELLSGIVLLWHIYNVFFILKKRNNVFEWGVKFVLLLSIVILLFKTYYFMNFNNLTFIEFLMVQVAMFLFVAGIREVTFADYFTYEDLEKTNNKFNTISMAIIIVIAPLFIANYLFDHQLIVTYTYVTVLTLSLGASMVSDFHQSKPTLDYLSKQMVPFWAALLVFFVEMDPIISIIYATLIFPPLLFQSKFEELRSINEEMIQYQGYNTSEIKYQTTFLALSTLALITVFYSTQYIFAFYEYVEFPPLDFLDIFILPLLFKLIAYIFSNIFSIIITVILAILFILIPPVISMFFTPIFANQKRVPLAFVMSAIFLYPYDWYNVSNSIDIKPTEQTIYTKYKGESVVLLPITVSLKYKSVIHDTHAITSKNNVVTIKRDRRGRIIHIEQIDDISLLEEQSNTKLYAMIDYKPINKALRAHEDLVNSKQTFPLYQTITFHINESSISNTVTITRDMVDNIPFDRRDIIKEVKENYKNRY
jgi:hypothetical protein